MYESPLHLRVQQAAQALAEALSVGKTAPQPMGLPAQEPPPGGPPGALAPPPAAPPPGQAKPPEQGQLGLGPNQSPSPLQAVPSFKSAPVEAYLQKAAGRAQMPVGFARGGRVSFAVFGDD